MKKNVVVRLTLLILAVALFALVFVACEPAASGDGNINVLPDNTQTDTVKFTVTFIFNDGVTSNYSISGIASGNTVKPDSKVSAPTRKGYDFIGWYETKELFNKWDFSKDVVTSNVNLYAGWELSNPVFIDDDNFSFSSNEITYNVGSATANIDLSKKITLEHSNYEFAFFYDEECSMPVGNLNEAAFSLEHGDNVFFMEIYDNGKNVLYSYKFNVYRQMQYVVTFIGLNGEKLGTMGVDDGDTLYEAYDLTVTGHTVKWKTIEDKDFVFGKNGTIVNGDMSIYAYTVVNSYSAKLDANGGVVSNSTIQVTFGENYILPSPIKAGSSFIGWYTESGEQVTGANAVSIAVWHFGRDVTFIAKWKDIQYAIRTLTEVDGNIVEQASTGAVYGQSCAFDAHKKYDPTVSTEAYDEYGFVIDDEKCQIYAFDGWYLGNIKLSQDRHYVYDNVISDVTIVERWKIINVWHGLGDKDDVKATISDNITYVSNGNINFGDSADIQIVCNCKEHTFIGWEGVEAEDKSDVSTVFTINTDLDIDAEWKKYSVVVNTFLDDVNVSDLEIDADGQSMDIFSAPQYVSAGNNVFVEAINNQKYTFVGWFNSENVKTNAEQQFATNLTMPAGDLEINGKWLTTEYLISVDSAENNGSVRPVVKDNVVGAEFDFDVNVKTGFTFVGITISDNYVDEFYVPQAVVNYVANYVDTPVKVSANNYDAGAISYCINNHGQKYASTYGEEAVFDGNSIGDKLSLVAESYNGYVWLGWYEDVDGNKNLLTNSFSYDITITEKVRNLYAAWKAVDNVYTTKQFVYSKQAVDADTIVSKGMYYEYVNGGYVLTEDLRFSKDKSYYVRSDTATGVGDQKITSITSRDGNLRLNLTATINVGYRFDGWYDSKGNWISYDLSTSVLVATAESEYCAYYTRITDDYVIQAGYFDKPKNAGKAGICAYKVGESEGNFEEYCVLVVTTTKNEFDNTDAKGYDFYGIFETTQDKKKEISEKANALAIKNDYKEFVYDEKNKFLSKDGFTTYYRINVNQIEGNKYYYAVWYDYTSTEGYYKTVELVNSDTNAGKIYYLANNGIITLVAEPKESYVFCGWVDKDGKISSSDLVYNTGRECVGEKYTAQWKMLNGENGHYRIKSNINGAGKYSITAVDTVDYIKINFELSATYDGYQFLGWYTDNKLVTFKDKFNIILTPNADGGYYRTLSVENDVTGEVEQVANFDYFDFEARWKKLDSIIIVESVGDVEIKGHVGVDGKTYYTVRVASDSYFEKDGLAWYGDYYFNGWYNENNQKIEDIGNQLMFTLSAEDFEKYGYYYKASWTEINKEISVNITNNLENDTTATRYFVTKLEGGGYEIVLQAFVKENYIFEGWYNTVTGSYESFDTYYVYQAPESVKAINLKANFNNIIVEGQDGFTLSSELIGDAIDSSQNKDYGKPYVVGYMQDNNTYKYTLYANPSSGYQFCGWYTKGVGNEEDKLHSEEAIYKTTTVGNRLAGAYVARYKLMSSAGSLPNFKLVTDYPQYVKFYAYTASEKLVVRFDVDVPNGYYYEIVDDLGRKIPSLLDNPYSCITDDANRTFYLNFGHYGDDLGRNLTYNEQVDNISINYSGYIIKNEEKDFLNNAYYVEKWASMASFEDNQYEFIGWYDSDGKLLSVTDEYEFTAYSKNTALQARFGYYKIDFDTNDEEAGDLSAKDYDVTVTFELNNYNINPAHIGGVVPNQVLNVNDKVKYPTNYVNNVKISGYLFAGWYDNAECLDEPYDFTKPISSNLTLYAKWINLSNIGASDSTVITYDGVEKQISSSTIKKSLHFVSLIDGYYYLFARMATSGKSVDIEINGESYQINSLLFGSEGIKIAVEKGKIYEIGIRATQNNEDVITFKLYGDIPEAGGERKNTLAYGTTFVASAEEKYGHIFEGWYINGVLVSGVKEIEVNPQEPDRKIYVYDKNISITAEEFAYYAGEDNRISLYAKWSRYEAEVIQTNYDAGTVNCAYTVVEDGKYKDANAWFFTAIAVNNYVFRGWYEYDEENHVETLLSEVTQYTHVIEGKDITVVARWEYVGGDATEYTITYIVGGGANNSPKNVDRFYSTNTTIITLYAPTREYDVDSITGYYIFEGWYTDQKFENKIETINPATETENIRLYAKWGKAVCAIKIEQDSRGQYIEFGEYPQTLVIDQAEIAEISDKMSIDGYYHGISNGKRYAKVSITTPIVLGDKQYLIGDYYFRVEPIRWNVISKNGKIALIESDLVLDTYFYNITTSQEIINGKTVYANNWEHSDLRSFLNGSFMQSCFNELERNLISLYQTKVSNASNKGDINYSNVDNYPWSVQNNTEDYLFVMSYSEKTDESIGYQNLGYVSDNQRQAIASDYCVFKLVDGYYDEVDGVYYANYWLRSPTGLSTNAYTVDENGAITKGDNVNSGTCGVRPVIYLEVEN